MSEYEPVILTRAGRKYLMEPCGPHYNPGFFYLGARAPAKRHPALAIIRFKYCAGRMIITNVEVARRLQRQGVATRMVTVLVELHNPISIEVECPNHNSTPWWRSIELSFPIMFPRVEVVPAREWVDPVMPDPDDKWAKMTRLIIESIAEDRAWQAKLLERKARKRRRG
jgi:hypothetical protein